MLFGVGAKSLKNTDEAGGGGGGGWALVDAARHVSDAPSRAMLLTQAKTFARGIGGARFPAALRPLSMLAALAIRDAHHGEPFEREGTPPRAAAMFRHRMVGRLPRAS